MKTFVVAIVLALVTSWANAADVVKLKPVQAPTMQSTPVQSSKTMSTPVQSSKTASSPVQSSKGSTPYQVSDGLSGGFLDRGQQRRLDRMNRVDQFGFPVLRALRNLLSCR